MAARRQNSEPVIIAVHEIVSTGRTQANTAAAWSIPPHLPYIAMSALVTIGSDSSPTARERAWVCRPASSTAAEALALRRLARVISVAGTPPWQRIWSKRENDSAARPSCACAAITALQETRSFAAVSLKATTAAGSSPARAYIVTSALETEEAEANPLRAAWAWICEPRGYVSCLHCFEDGEGGVEVVGLGVERDEGVGDEGDVGLAVLQSSRVDFTAGEQETGIGACLECNGVGVRVVGNRHGGEDEEGVAAFSGANEGCDS
ncbi:hypothetical protein IEQ34_007441 [Dendrobium chrysotoxum]|uniref:Uncharacterized protein n=1 Tax=Dendrobium chrysotoxum TaxID=161865 RepID=A0AAV7GS31_DENCH|nr:hypothetical protein IEQ34_007441 [Dendrobium chrysotoxum]